jgi:Fe-S-cluster containining protein
MTREPVNKRPPLGAEEGDLLEPLPAGKRFRFSCHKSVPCFTDCCRDLHLVLTPYDVLRVERALGMDSTEFLEKYTEGGTDPDWGVPIVKLRMGATPGRSCPFVTKDGCSIYADRPGACRAYPLGRAARRSPARSVPGCVEEQYFLVRETHCLGFQETEEWTAGAWMNDQGLAPYNGMNDLWMGFLSRYRPGSRKELGPKQWQMFFMACYSLDRFREFVFGTRFLSVFSIPRATEEKIRKTDEELLRFSFQWLAFSLFGDPVLKLRADSLDNARF